MKIGWVKKWVASELLSQCDHPDCCFLLKKKTPQNQTHKGISDCFEFTCAETPLLESSPKIPHIYIKTYKLIKCHIHTLSLTLIIFEEFYFGRKFSRLNKINSLVENSMTPRPEDPGFICTQITLKVKKHHWRY